MTWTLSASTFRPAVQPPDEQPDRPVAWFAFRGDRLLVRIDPAGEGVTAGQAELVSLPDWREVAELAAAGALDARHYLGRLGEVDCYALELAEECQLPSGFDCHGLRALFGRLAEEHFSVAARAVQILEWERTHRFCGRCGEPTVRSSVERAMQCPRCGLLSFPRLSPAVIMLVQKGDDEILLGRNVNFADGFYSVLAGFVEPGESLEEAVNREIYEEVGLTIQDVRYFGSQPWPFPHQLMIGFTASYASGEIRVDPTELVDAAWFSKRGELPKLPGKISIARRLIDWALEH